MTPSPIYVFVGVRIFGDFLNLTPASDGQNFYPTNFLSCVNEYIEGMVTFTTWVKIYFCNTKVAGVGRNFCPVKILGFMVLHVHAD